jgi:hypothetical protein
LRRRWQRSREQRNDNERYDASNPHRDDLPLIPPIVSQPTVSRKTYSTAGGKRGFEKANPVRICDNLGARRQVL